jgi:hypothetical protein
MEKLPFSSTGKRFSPMLHNANRINRDCAGGGAQGCSRLAIKGGSADIDKLASQQKGTMECIVPIATFTTLTTSIRSTTTVVNAVVETVLSTRVEKSVSNSTKTARTMVPSAGGAMWVFNSTAKSTATAGAATRSTGNSLRVSNTTLNSSLPQAAMTNTAIVEQTTTTLSSRQSSLSNGTMSNSTFTLTIPVAVPTTAKSTIPTRAETVPMTILPVTT